MTPTQSPTNREFVSLKEHLESRIDSVEKSITIANVAMQERLKGMNEFRDTLREQASRFITRDESEAKRAAIVAHMDVKMEAMCEQLRILEKYQSQMEGKVSQSQFNLNLLLTVVALLLSIVGTIIAVTK
jgi:hypothetical protein